MEHAETILRSFKPLLCAAALAACASAPVPTAGVASAQAAIRASDVAGAHGTPAAALHLRLAREEFAAANDIIDRGGDVDRARFILMRSEADAELALALAQETHSRDQAQAAADQARSTREQLR